MQNFFTNLKCRFNHRRHGKHGIKEIREQSFRAFSVFRGYKVSENIYVWDYNCCEKSGREGRWNEKGISGKGGAGREGRRCRPGNI